MPHTAPPTISEWGVEYTEFKVLPHSNFNLTTQYS
jgi:hypothetical protein